MDIVYILGKGSEVEDEELRYSLRSMCINMLDLDRVFVVGEHPLFLKDIYHIPCDDIFEKDWQNALAKTRLASKWPSMTDEFLLMNDDFFANKPFEGKELPFYAVKGGEGGCNGKLDFRIHAPIRLKCDWFNKLPLTPEMKGDWSPRTFYCNFYQAPPTYVANPMITTGDNAPPFQNQIVKYPFFSIKNTAVHSYAFSKWLTDKYPKPCRFET